ncbi:MAG: ornithine--oxo-acid transaminase [Acidobacteria bacterium]|nr:ornithine--oxo-acid transaminase [Acidobacteriota bacterium]NIM63990.1 ornithine--oxo-acid transaminase [Acidobacteriota bacterium]NIO60196.1 ornithine--oxo-acid transaminase [Acidobacteriota bacterium]NIQ31258.1 ornithine--oxo-acid transaminase [Acidobacteriota bacterium]NIQ86406.1 ornithine--oxo-acid transaminase [Acidobacteriota bacterium]
METTNTRSSAFIRLEDDYGANNYHPLDVVLCRGEGVWVWDVEGNKYLDFLAAYSAVNQGHAHPKIREALVEQSDKVTLTSRAFRTDQLGPLYEEMHELTGFQRMLPMNTGAEAVETAIKAARKWGYKVKGVPEGQAEILVFSGNFHGRTTTIVGFSDEAQYKDGFGPFTPGFTLLPYGDLDAVREAMNPNVVGVLIEPIQGESGIIIPPEGYLAGIAELCREHNALLMTDEIQSGLGRTGKLFAFEHEGVRPDVVIIGKALAGGFYPVSAILADDEVMGVFHPGDHGSTFGGNPLGCAVARAALRVLRDENLIENSAELGTYFLDKLRRIDSPLIKEIRGVGLWIGLELTGSARPFCEALQRKGLLCKETHENTIRFAPPLIITREELDWAFERVVELFNDPPASQETDP